MPMTCPGSHSMGDTAVAIDGHCSIVTIAYILATSGLSGINMTFFPIFFLELPGQDTAQLIFV